jgi:hypothetical protein
MKSELSSFVLMKCLAISGDISQFQTSVYSFSAKVCSKYSAANSWIMNYSPEQIGTLFRCVGYNPKANAFCMPHHDAQVL